MQRHILMLTISVLTACGGKSHPPPDFAVGIDPHSVTVVEGETSGVVAIAIGSINGFDSGVSVSISGLPPGTTTNPAFPMIVQAGCCDPNMEIDAVQYFYINTTDATPTGTVTLTLRGTYGSLAHESTMTLTVNPVVQTSQQGTMLYLQSHANGHTARIGLDTAWGGAIVEASIDGTNFVNRHDPGREVQPALYDGADQYPDLGPGSLYGWDPVLAGDAYGRGSTVLQQTISADSLYTSTAPLQWWPDNFGGGASMAVAADMTFEQTVTVAPGAPLAFKVHYKLIHNGSDTHYNSGQEFPAVYVNSTYTNFAYYGGSSPWTNGGATILPAVVTPTAQFPAAVYAPELWGALIDDTNQGLAVYVPGLLPYEGARSFAGQTGTGPLGNTTMYMAPSLFRTIAPGAVIEGDVYLVPGDLSAARAAIYAIHATLPATDISAPLTSVDQPTANATISGISTIAGWAFDNVALSGVDVYVDGVAEGSAVTGGARPDVAAAYPHVAPPDSGWSFTLDTTKLSNGPHTIEVHALDAASNEAINAPIPVIISN